MFQKTVINFISLVLLIAFGYVLGVYLRLPRHSILNDSSTLKDSVIFVEDIRKVDSLTNLVEEYRAINTRLKDSLSSVVVTRIVEVESVKRLPLDSSVLFLKQKLREYEGNKDLLLTYSLSYF